MTRGVRSVCSRPGGVLEGHRGREVREEARGPCWSGPGEPPGHAPWTLALGCGSAAPAPTPRPALPSSFMPTAGPPASARSAAPLPAGAGAAQPLVAGQERHLDRSRHGKRRLSRRLSCWRSGSDCGRRGTATAWAGLEAGAGLVRHSEGAVRQRRAPRAWGSGPRVVRCKGAWLEWGRSL